MKGNKKRELKKQILEWLNSPDGRMRLVLLDLARGGIACEGMQIEGRNLIITARYDPELHRASIQEGDVIPDRMDKPVNQRWWMVGILARVLTARLTKEERAFLHCLYLNILRDGRVKEVVMALIDDLAAMIEGRIKEAQLANNIRVGKIS